MIVKPFRGRAKDIEELEALAARAGTASDMRRRIEREIAIIRAGEKGEREAAYEIDFHHGPSDNWAVIHNLRIEHEGRVAQMDHLVIGRFLDIWVCETKHFSEGVAINERGEFTRFFNRRPHPIPSPIEQNRKHLRVLDSILRSDKITLPTRLGLSIRPRLHSVILISQGARLTRPKTAVDGIETIVKSDQLRTLIERDIDTESMSTSLLTVGKLVSRETLEAFASQVARLHRPLRMDWATRFGDAGTQASSSNAVASPTSEEIEPLLEAAPSPSTVAVVAIKPDLIPTSKLGAALGLPNVDAALKHLQAAGLIRRVGEQFELTPAGVAAGGQFVAKSRFGPYFLWPRDLRC